MYTKMIRKYIEQNKGTTFDALLLHKKFFSIIPYKTYLKIIERFVDERLLSRVSKGVYHIVDEESADVSVEKFYISEHRGMYAGYKMYNDLGVSEHHENEIMIYTRAITKKIKHIENITLVYVDLMFHSQDILIIQALECLEHVNEIIEVSEFAIIEIVEKAAKVYMNILFESIIRSIKYKYSTIQRFAEILDKMNIKNECIRIYEKHNS